MYSLVALTEVNRHHIGICLIILIAAANDVKNFTHAPVVTLPLVGGKVSQVRDDTAEQELMRLLFDRYGDARPRLTVLILHADPGGSLPIAVNVPKYAVH